MSFKKKKKGNNFEIRISKLLSYWASQYIIHEKQDDWIWHTSGSGSRATNRMKKNVSTSNSCGDLCYNDDRIKFLFDKILFELKSGYTHKIRKKNKGGMKLGEKVSITDLIDSPENRKKKPLLLRWIDKAKKEAKQHKKEDFVIIYKRDRKSSCIVLQFKTWEKLETNNRRFIFPHDGAYSHVCIDKNYDIVILRLEDFLYWCNPKAFVKPIFRINRRKYKQGKYTGNRIINFPKDLL